jgi:hypothetical protein
LTIDAPTLILKQAVPSKTIYKNVPVTEFTPVTATGGTGIYTYSISPSLPYNLAFSTTTGKISGTASTPDSARLYTVTITDSLGKSGSKTFYLTIDVAATISTTTVVPVKTVIRLIDNVNFTPVTASGGYGTITFAITPSLPTGLSFNTNNGVITGLASVKNANTLYIVTATDAISQNSNSSFYLTSINEPLQANRTSTADRQVYKYLNITPFTPVEPKGGFAPYTYSITPNLPEYVEFNSNSGLVNGNSISTIANTTFTITITDSEGSTNTNTLFTVHPLVTVKLVVDPSPV